MERTNKQKRSDNVTLAYAIENVIRVWKAKNDGTDELFCAQYGIASVGALRSWRSGARVPGNKNREKLIAACNDLGMMHEMRVISLEDLRDLEDNNEQAPSSNSTVRREIDMTTRGNVARPTVRFYEHFKAQNDMVNDFRPLNELKKDLLKECQSLGIRSILSRSTAYESFEEDPYLTKTPDKYFYYGERGHYYSLTDRDLVKLYELEEQLREYGQFLLYKKRNEDRRLHDFLLRLSKMYPDFNDPGDYWPGEDMTQNTRNEWREKVRIDELLHDLEHGGNRWLDEYMKMLEQDQLDQQDKETKQEEEKNGKR